MKNNKLQERLNFLLCNQDERKNKLINLTIDNKRKIQSLKNKYAKETCFIIGSSPSLNLLDLTKLNNKYTFTLNRGYLLKEKGLLHSTFHAISDINILNDKNSKKELLKNYSDKLFCYAGIKNNITIDTIYFDYIQSELKKDICFQDDLTKPLIAYQSVVHFIIQIAYYLGFNKIYLLGIDLDFKENKGHIYNETQGEKERENISIINAPKMLKGLELCTKWLNKNNVEIFNASPCGIVDCMPKINYKEIFNE